MSNAQIYNHTAGILNKGCFIKKIGEKRLWKTPSIAPSHYGKQNKTLKQNKTKKTEQTRTGTFF